MSQPKLTLARLESLLMTACDALRGNMDARVQGIRVLRQQGEMAQQRFNVGEICELLVALPDLYEQKRISDKSKATSAYMVKCRALNCSR